MNDELSREHRAEVKDDVAPEAQDTKSPDRSSRGSIFAHAADPANGLTLAGLFCALLGIYFAAQGLLSAAVIALLWATFFDWFDGPVARRTKGRSDELGALGGQLDSLVDIVSGGVGPAILLLSVGAFSPLFIPGAFAIVAAGVLRLSYFNVHGLEDETTYLGLPIDHNVILLSMVFLLEGQIGGAEFATVLYVATVLIAILSIAPFRMPKLVGHWYFIFTGFVVVLTAVYGWRLWMGLP
jgi:phosphatidylserine synthase